MTHCQATEKDEQTCSCWRAFLMRLNSTSTSSSTSSRLWRTRRAFTTTHTQTDRQTSRACTAQQCTKCASAENPPADVNWIGPVANFTIATPGKDTWIFCSTIGLLDKLEATFDPISSAALKSVQLLTHWYQFRIVAISTWQRWLGQGLVCRFQQGLWPSKPQHLVTQTPFPKYTGVLNVTTLRSGLLSSVWRLWSAWLPFPADCGGVSWPCQWVSYSLSHGAWKENSPTDRRRAWDGFSVSAFINLGAALQLRATPRFFCPWWLPGLSVTPYILNF